MSLKSCYLKKNKTLRLLIISALLLAVAVTIFIIYKKPFDRKSRIIALSDSLPQSLLNDIVLPPNSYYYDFEGISSNENNKVLYHGIAQSGQTSTKAFGSNSFSLIIEKTAEEIGLSNLRKAALSGKIYLFPLRDSLQSALVFSILKPDGKSVFWQGVGINGKTNLPIEQWFQVSGEFNLSEVNIHPEDVIRIYLWNNSNNDMLLDDLFVIYGEEADRYGTHSPCDLTVSKFSGIGPPYPVLYFFNDNINNQSSRFLVNNGNIKTGDLISSDFLIEGYFLNKKGGLQSLICGTETPGIFHYCQANKSFSHTALTLDAGTSLPADADYLAADFDGNGFEEIFVSNTKKGELALFKVDYSGNMCLTDNKNALLINLWRSGKNDLPTEFPGGNFKCYAADFDADNNSELLIIEENGKWNLLKWTKSTWKKFAGGTLPYFKKQEYNISIYSGKLPGKIDREGLIIYGTETPNNNPISMILVYNRISQSFEKLNTKGNKNTIAFSGYDTLKHTDILYHAGQGKEKFILRYNTDWRYDFKALDYTSDSFVIKYDIDFKGNPQGQNPKYYEHLRILPGNWVKPMTTSLLLIYGNTSKTDNSTKGNKIMYIDKAEFPVRVQLYSPSVVD